MARQCGSDATEPRSSRRNPFPRRRPALTAAIVQDVLHIHFQDNVQARRLRPDGSYAPESAAQHRGD